MIQVQCNDQINGGFVTHSHFIPLLRLSVTQLSVHAGSGDCSSRGSTERHRGIYIRYGNLTEYRTVPVTSDPRLALA